MPSSDDLVNRIDALCEPVAEVDVRVRHPGGETTEVEVRPHAASGLGATVTVRPPEVAVGLGRWRHAWSSLADADEVLDLVAAVLFGRVRLREHVAGERAFRWDVEVAVDDRWVHHDTERRLHWKLWQPTTTRVYRNAIEPPPSVSLGSMGRLPYAPWVGLLDAADEGPGLGTLPVDGELDLHPFSPKEIAGVVRAYIEACRQRGITELRIVHGKGIGNLRRTVHALLDRHPDVAGYRLGGHGGGGWGATVVDLRVADDGGDEP
jgi:hypothetical protein